MNAESLRNQFAGFRLRMAFFRTRNVLLASVVLAATAFGARDRVVAAVPHTAALYAAAGLSVNLDRLPERPEHRIGFRETIGSIAGLVVFAAFLVWQQVAPFFRVPDGDRFWFAGGVTYSMTPQVDLDLSGAYVAVKEERIDVVDTLPKTATGKIQRFKLRD